ncbi:MAG: glycogen synthase GlgA [Burkholderiaceae bacterium]
MMRILHVASEVVPLVKTGGLGDVVGALPVAQKRLGADARLLIPGYPAVIDKLKSQDLLSHEPIFVGPAFGASGVRLLRATLPETDVPLFVLDAPWLFQREGELYTDPLGKSWSDNHLRFGLFGWVAAQITAGQLVPDWAPDLLHCHDWHAGLAFAYLAQHPVPSAPRVFTIHNLAFQGLFPANTASALMLSDELMTPNFLEFHRDLSFIKAGLVFADLVTTVSPNYALEILRPEFGHGLDGLLRTRKDKLLGVLNGIDTQVWNPATDRALAEPFSINSLDAREVNRVALTEEFGLPAPITDHPVLGVVSRLSAQKGLDVLVSQMPEAIEHGCQFVILGTGDPEIESSLVALQRQFPDRVSVRIGFDEQLAHRIYGGSDAVIVPSRFEPCGLTQLYGLRYGAVPIVTPVGGLADTVVDESNPLPGRPANGFVHASGQKFALTLIRAIDAFRDKARWRALVSAGMREDNSWDQPARAYLDAYQQIKPKQWAL